MSDNGISLGTIMIVFMSIIVGVILFQVIAQQVGTSTNTQTVVNQSETLAANGESIYIEEYRALSDVVIINASGEEVIASGNYTITNNVINPTTGALSVKVTTDDAEYESVAVEVSGTAQPLTYIADNGGRAIASLIAVFFALAILAVTLYPVYEGTLRQMMGM